MNRDRGQYRQPLLGHIDIVLEHLNGDESWEEGEHLILHNVSSHRLVHLYGLVLVRVNRNWIFSSLHSSIYFFGRG